MPPSSAAPSGLGVAGRRGAGGLRRRLGSAAASRLASPDPGITPTFCYYGSQSSSGASKGGIRPLCDSRLLRPGLILGHHSWFHASLLCRPFGAGGGGAPWRRRLTPPARFCRRFAAGEPGCRAQTLAPPRQARRRRELVSGFWWPVVGGRGSVFGARGCGAWAPVLARAGGTEGTTGTTRTPGTRGRESRGWGSCPTAVFICGYMAARNPKLETRNPKRMRSSKRQCSKRGRIFSAPNPIQAPLGLSSLLPFLRSSSAASA